jgi:GT2 family glycosyltransferase
MFFDASYLSQILSNNKLFGRKRYAGWNFDTVREVDVVIGCYSFVRMEAIKQVGVMDDIFFLYGDDIDWCYRFVKAGWKVMFFPGARIIHYGGQATLSNKRRARRFMYQLYGAGLINVKKHYNKKTFFICRLLTALFFFFRVPSWFIKGFIQKGEKLSSFCAARDYFWGGVYSLFNWTKLLINQDEVKQKLYGH